jgi:5-methylcytosine-specific restriction endonuclease McrA
MDTLVLSSWYEPVARISWRRAVTLLFAGKVEVIDEYADREIRSVSFSIKMPSVVRFLRALRGRKRGVKFSRENVYLRDGARCQYCERKVPRSEATYDHVVPRAQGGKTNWDNVVIACLPCNQRKGGRTPVEARMTLRTAPVRPKKLAEGLHLTITFKDGMPATWRAWLRDFSYWNGELDSDDE